VLAVVRARRVGLDLADDFVLGTSNNPRFSVNPTAQR
jgi:hypothetical protein